MSDVVQGIALTDAAVGRERQHHGFRDDKSNHPCCTLCRTSAMQSKQQMRQHEAGRRHQDNYDEYIRIIRAEQRKRARLAFLDPKYEHVVRMVAVKQFSSGPVPEPEAGNPFWIGDLRKVKSAAYDWIDGVPDEDERLFNLFHAAWQRHVDRVRMDLLMLAFMQHSKDTPWSDLASVILPFLAEGEAVSWRRFRRVAETMLYDRGVMLCVHCYWDPGPTGAQALSCRWRAPPTPTVGAAREA